MVSEGKADCGRIRKEKSESGRLWDAGKNGKEEDEWRRGEADCGRIRREKSKNEGCSNAVGARGQ